MFCNEHFVYHESYSNSTLHDLYNLLIVQSQKDFLPAFEIEKKNQFLAVNKLQIMQATFVPHSIYTTLCLVCNNLTIQFVNEFVKSTVILFF